MYLLEYRNAKIPLAGGGMFRIPENVRLIGTMNTADRSIALVDHALRRRFAFIALHPEYDILLEYQKARGFDATKLIQQLKLLNRVIADRHYEVGITFFLRDDLTSDLSDVWQMEIEPYLEEFFFDQPQKFEQFRWETVHRLVMP
jgi:5-methylcytosine-specific restriction enzyme B